MRKFMLLMVFLITIILIPQLVFATLTVTRIPVTKTGGSAPVLQNGSITDLGTSSGTGNVGIGSSTPGQNLDVQGTLRVLNGTVVSPSNADDQIFNVRNYGAKGNGVHLIDGACSTGTSTAFSSSSASFTSNDVGKVISLVGAGSAGVDLTTTFSAFVDSHDMTLTAGCSTTVSGASYEYGTDDTTSIQNAINAVGTNGVGTVYFPAGIYIVNGAYQNVSKENSQLILPEVDVVNTGMQHIVLKGANKRPEAQLSTQASTSDAGSIIFCTRIGNSAGQSCLSGWGVTQPPSSTTYFDGVNLEINKLNFRTVTNPVNSLLNFASTSQISIYSSTLDTAVMPALPTLPTNAGSTALILPYVLNFGSQNVKDVYILGYYVGVQCSEHGVLDNVYINKIHTGIVVYGNPYNSYPEHTLHLGYVCIQTFVYGISFITGPGKIVADDLDFETLGTGGWTTVDYFYDPNNYAYGEVHWLNFNNTTVSINGGANLIVHQLNLSDTGNIVTLGNVGVGSANPGAAVDVYGGNIRVLNAGNVSIGSTIPGGMLDVEGTVNPVIFGGISNGSTFKNVGIGSFSPGYMLDVAGGGRFLGSGNTALNPTVGNVGIGTILSTNLLDVAKNEAIGVTYAGYQVAPANGLIVQGNVGIGSITPGQALDVQGTVRGISGGTCTTLYRCQGGADAGIIQTVACVLCPTSTCVAMNGCF